MKIRVFESFEALPRECLDLLQRAGATNFYAGLPWFRNLAQTVMAPGDALRIYVIERGDRSNSVAGLFVARLLGRKNRLVQPLTVAGLTSLYTTEFDLVCDPTADVEPIAKALAESFAADRPRWDAVEIKALQPTAPLFKALVEALRRAGFAVQPYFQFGSWYEATDNLRYQEYVKRLPKGLRQLRKKLSAPNGPVYRLLTDADLEWGIREYERLYKLSWKEAEPHPDFTAGLARAAAKAGTLRFGVLSLQDQPIAAQIWIVVGGRATIFKVVHDEAHKRLSPGSILTGCVMEHVLDVDHVREVDFGRGDDGYKKMWLPRRREFWAINAFNLRTVKGAASALRHVALTRAAQIVRPSPADESALGSKAPV